MSKLIVPFLMLGAVLYALWLTLSRAPLPDVSRAAGFRKRFYLATVLFASMLTLFSGSSGCRPGCYVPMPPNESARVAMPRDVLSALRATWLTLDPESGKEFRRILERAAWKGYVSKRTSQMLALAFSELADHRERTRGNKKRASCYDMTALWNAVRTSREAALKQVELLREAERSGTVASETASKARAALERELEMLRRSRAIRNSANFERKKWLVEEYSQSRLRPSDPAKMAASLIVRLEMGPEQD